jgi:steroid delta-isomerase-like uncharacterized protein
MTDTNAALVRRWTEEGYGRGKLALVDELFAVDFVNHTPLPGQSPDREGVREAVVTLRNAFADLEVTIEDIIAEGDRIAVRDRTHARHVGVFAGIPPTGKDVTVLRIAIYRVADDRIVDHWASVDMLGLLQQLGATVALGRPER